jgi:predicted nucleotidyltransferase
MINLEQLTEDLVSKHQPKLILLYGSYARGEFTPKSDIDVVCFKDVDCVQTDTREFNGLYLDAWVKPLSHLENTEELIYLQGAKVLFDPENLSQEMFTSLDKLLESPPKAISDEEKEHLHAWTLKMLDRTYRGDIEANYRRQWLIFELLTIYFKLNQMWYRGSKLAFRELKEKKPEIYKRFDRVLKNPTDSILLKQLVYKILKL